MSPAPGLSVTGRVDRRLAPLSALGSPRLTLLCFAALGVGAYLTAQRGVSPTWAAGIPLAMLGLNLVAAMLSHPRLRTNAALATLHVSLLAALVLAGASRLSYFDGLATLDVGESFQGLLEDVEAGPLHRWRPDALGFRNAGFVERYPERGDYVSTDHHVRWTGPDGREHQSVIGDDRPLILGDYRIYATTRRGYSPVFVWQGATGTLETGSVQLPVPGFAIQTIQPLTIDGTEQSPLTAAQAWALPDGTEAWIMLDAAPAPAPTPGQTRRNLGTASLEHHLVLRIGDQRRELRPGDVVDLPNGRLVYRELGAWMGYRIIADPFMNWLFAACTAVVLSLTWFYVERFRANSWLKGED